MRVLPLVHVFCIIMCAYPPVLPSKRLHKKRRVDLFTTPELIKRQGYPLEIHHVTTKDGFILEMHRIPHGHSQNVIHNLKPVLVLHGAGQSSADWVVNSPIEDSLGFRLADSGYDVWLGNLRGNDYSNRNILFTIKNNGFWNHSFHEQGIYDTPAMIDYITMYTGQPRLHYIGYSLSTTSLFVTLSKEPEYNKKIATSVMMAPAAFVPGFFNGLFRHFSPIALPFIKLITILFGDLSIPTHFISIMLHKILPVVSNPILDPLGIVLRIFQFAMLNVNGLITKDRLPSVLGVFPNPTAVKVFTHAFQLAASGRFQEFDYGPRKNLRMYGTVCPPDYDISNVQIPISIIAGLGDRTITPEDVQTLARSLPNLVDFHFVENPRFTHLDFAFGKGVGKLVYSRIISTLDAFDRNLI